MKPIDLLRYLFPLAARVGDGKSRYEPPSLPDGSIEILEHLPIGVFLTQPDGRFIYANPALAQLLGYPSMAALPASPADMYMNMEDRRAWRSKLDAEGVLRGHVTRIRHADGEAIWVEISAHIVHDAGGQPQYIAGALVDITARIQTELTVEQMTALLRESESRYLGLFENSPVALWEEDFSGVKEYIDTLKRRGVTDFKAFLVEHPEAVDDCLSLVRVDDVNMTTLRFYHARTKSELLSNLPVVLGPEARHIFAEELLVIADGGVTFESEGQNRTINGQVIDIFLRWAVAPGYEDTYGKVFVSTIDITERKRAERRERAQAERSAVLTQISREILEVGLDSRAIYHAIVQRVAGALGGACGLALLDEAKASVNVVAFRHSNQARQRSLAAAFPVWPVGVAVNLLRRVVDSGEPVYLPEVTPEQINEIAPSDETDFAKIFHLRSLILAPLGPPGSVIGVLAAMREQPDESFILEDVAFLSRLAGYTALTILNAQVHDLVRRQSQTDAMTGAYNRSYLIRLSEIEFERARRYHHPMAAVMIDLDFFKSINDTYGHLAGDVVLAGVVERCRSLIRSYDIFGRFGGEEFMIVMPETDLEGAFAMAERLRQVVGDDPFVVDGQQIRATISLGVASTNDMTPTLAALLGQADTAMYAAKRAGRNRVAK